MRAPRFWYPQKGTPQALFLAFLFIPLSYIYRFVTSFMRALARPYKARIPVICVGNIVAGGAGKTPTALALASLLKKYGHKPVFVTRGYKGTQSSKSLALFVDHSYHTAAEVGDEALLLAAVAPTWVGTDKTRAIQEAESYGSVVIMDDGLQNPTIAPSASLLVIDGDVGLGNGYVLPMGPLRETFESCLQRVKALVIIGDQDCQNIAKKTKRPVFKAALKPHPSTGFPRDGKFIAFAGIGRPEKFYATARSYGLDLCDTHDFPDHHMFTDADIDLLRLKAEEQGALLLTTEKDAVRLPPSFRAEVVILPVTLSFEKKNGGDELVKLCLGLD